MKYLDRFPPVAVFNARVPHNEISLSFSADHLFNIDIYIYFVIERGSGTIYHRWNYGLYLLYVKHCRMQKLEYTQK